jgi:16S rRNA (adenine(1408)-N(1))-methyltransferase
VLDEARKHPDRLFIGIDAVAPAMADASRRAAAKPARGGVSNALFVHASLEDLPCDLAAVADRLTVNYPWSSLLRAVARPDIGLLSKIAALAKTKATLDVLVNLHPFADPQYAARLGLAGAALVCDRARLREGYALAGFSIVSVGPASGAQARVTRRGRELFSARREILRVKAVVVR